MPRDHAVVPQPGELRITLLAALAWRAMAEIVRRRHVDYRFDVLQIHPGISMAGLIELHLHAHDGRHDARLCFNLGGPSPGTWQAADGDGGHLLHLLGPNPVDVIDAIERSAGLPAWPGHRLPPSTPGVRAMRRIAAELEGKVFQPVPWRTTVAFVGGGPDIVCDWHRHFTAQVTADAWGGVRSEDRTRLSQLVLLHEAPDEGCVTGQASLQGEGLVVDLASGQVARMTAKAIDPPGPKG
jgi:hypothetical protein